MKYTELYDRQKDQFKRSWLTVLILYVQRLVLVGAIVGAGMAIYYLLAPHILQGRNFLWVYIGLWLLLAYVILPRVHRILSAIYVPSYFIGRVRTRDGLLGDPVNLAGTGTEAQLREAMLAAGWVEADDLGLKSSVKTVVSWLRRRPYPHAPVSTLLLFGRKQDLAFQQEVQGNLSQRHHVRFWKTPEGWLLPGGFRVDWLAAATFDRSVGFSLYTLQITHKIAERTDEERDYLVETLVDSRMIGGVEVIKNFSTGYHHRNGGGDTIVTDGDLPIVHFAGDRDDTTPVAAVRLDR